MGRLGALVMALACASACALMCGLSWGCGGNDASMQATAPTAAVTTGDPIAGFKPCGGDPQGAWRIDSYHTDLAEASRIVDDSFGDEPACADSLKDVTSRAEGTFTFKADGTYEDIIAVSADFELDLTDACFTALAGDAATDPEIRLTDPECAALQDNFEKQMTFSAAACGFQTSVCMCALSVQDQPTPGGGSYAVNEHELVLNGAAWSFCVNGNRLEMKQTGPDGTELLIMSKI